MHPFDSSPPKYNWGHVAILIYPHSRDLEMVGVMKALLSKEESKRLHCLCHLGVPKSGRGQKGYIIRTVSWSPKRGGIKKATEPLPSRDPPKEGRNQTGCITPSIFDFSSLWGPNYAEKTPEKILAAACNALTDGHAIVMALVAAC